MTTFSTLFSLCFDLTVGHEGGYDTTRADPGNWTGGEVGHGELKGTKYGISAASYPTVDIAGLTLDAAKAIYAQDYWAKVSGEGRDYPLPGPLAFILFDGAVNSGPIPSVQWLQIEIGVAQDGKLGPITRGAAKPFYASQNALDDLCARVIARRIVFASSLSTWRTFGLGWARRFSAIPYQTIPLRGL